MLFEIDVKIIVNWAQLGVCSFVDICAIFIFIAVAIESKC